MRIIAGIHKGRKLVTLPGLHTRPMMDRMKESVFNIIGPYFSDEKVLDLFGGSGALSLEALSRGCQQSYIVEVAPAAIRIIEINVRNLNEGDRVFLFKCDYQVALNKLKNDSIQFDLIFLDPPYKLKVIDQVLNYLLDNDMLHHDAHIICHYCKNDHQSKETERLRIVKNYSYATNEVTIYQKRGE